MIKPVTGGLLVRILVPARVPPPLAARVMTVLKRD